MEITYDPLLKKVRKKDDGSTPGGDGIPPVTGAIAGDSVILKDDGTLETLNASHQYIQPGCGWGDTDLGTFEITGNDTLTLKAPFTFYNSKGRKVEMTTDVSLPIPETGAYLHLFEDNGAVVSTQGTGITNENLKNRTPFAITNKGHNLDTARLIDFRISKDTPYTDTVLALRNELTVLSNGLYLSEISTNHHGELLGGSVTLSSFRYNTDGLTALMHAYVYANFIYYTGDTDNSLLWSNGSYNPRNGGLAAIPDDKLTWVNVIYFPYMTETPVIKMLGRTLYDSVSEAKADLYTELIRLQDDLALCFKPLFLQAILIDNTGIVYATENINRSNIKAAPIVIEPSSSSSFYRDIVYAGTAGSTYTLPTDYNAGDRIRYLFNALPPAIIKPDATQRIFFENTSFTPAYGTGYIYASMSQWGEISFEYIGDNKWRVISWSGRFIYEGARAWFPFDDAVFIQPTQNNWATIIKEKLFNQRMIGNNVIYTVEDSPYIKTDNVYANITYGVFHTTSINVDQYGLADIKDVQNLNPFNNTDKDFTMEIWVKRTAVGNGYDQTIFECGAGNNYDSYRLFFNGWDKPSLAVFSTSNTLLLLESPDSITNDDLWHRISFLKRGNKVALYVDREKKASDTLTASMNFTGEFKMFSDRNEQYHFIGRVKDLFFVEGKLYEIDIDSTDLLPVWRYTPNWLELASGVAL